MEEVESDQPHELHDKWYCRLTGAMQYVFRPSNEATASTIISMEQFIDHARQITHVYFQFSKPVNHTHLLDIVRDHNQRNFEGFTFDEQGTYMPVVNEDECSELRPILHFRRNPSYHYHRDGVMPIFDTEHITQMREYMVDYMARANIKRLEEGDSLMRDELPSDMHDAMLDRIKLLQDQGPNNVPVPEVPVPEVPNVDEDLVYSVTVNEAGEEVIELD